RQPGSLILFCPHTCSLPPPPRRTRPPPPPPRRWTRKHQRRKPRRLLLDQTMQRKMRHVTTRKLRLDSILCRLRAFQHYLVVSIEARRGDRFLLCVWQILQIWKVFAGERRIADRQYFLFRVCLSIAILQDATNKRRSRRRIRQSVALDQKLSRWIDQRRKG